MVKLQKLVERVRGEVEGGRKGDRNRGGELEQERWGGKGASAYEGRGKEREFVQHCRAV